MRLKIDTDKCTGHGRCYSLSPELFATDDEGFGVAIDVDASRFEDAANRAIVNCPEHAISRT